MLLQNAWRYNAQPGQTEWMPGRPPDIGRKFLERAIWKSATGRNLKEMLPLAEIGEENVMLREASPYIGNVASSKFPMDPDFVCQQIREYKPDVVLLLGAEARKARPFVEAAGVEVVEGDHPVARTLSKAGREMVRNQVLDCLLRLKQASEHIMSITYWHQ